MYVKSPDDENTKVYSSQCIMGISSIMFIKAHKEDDL